MDRNIFAVAHPVLDSAARYNEPIKKMLDELQAYVSASYWLKLRAVRDDVRASELEYQQDLYAFLANMLTVAKFDRQKENAMTDYITRDGAICAAAEAISFLKQAQETIKKPSPENLFTKCALAELAKIDNYFTHIIPEAKEYRYNEGMKQLNAALALVSAEESGDNPVKACLLQAIDSFGRASKKPSEFQNATTGALWTEKNHVIPESEKQANCKFYLVAETGTKRVNEVRAETEEEAVRRYISVYYPDTDKVGVRKIERTDEYRVMATAILSDTHINTLVAVCAEKI